jgi:hypothetical protein
MKSLTVKVEDALYERLDEHVRRRGQTKNGLILALLEAYLAAPRGLSGVPLTDDHPFWGLVGTMPDGAGVSRNVDAFLYGTRRRRR